MDMKQIYAAGRFDNGEFDTRVYKGLQNGMEILMYNETPRCSIPEIEFTMELVNSHDDYHAWIRMSDVMYVGKNWKTDSKAKEEIIIARQSNIPVFYHLDDMIGHFAE